MKILVSILICEHLLTILKLRQNLNIHYQLDIEDILIEFLNVPMPPLPFSWIVLLWVNLYFFSTYLSSLSSAYHCHWRQVTTRLWPENCNPLPSTCSAVHQQYWLFGHAPTDPSISSLGAMRPSSSNLFVWAAQITQPTPIPLLLVDWTI